MHACTQFQVSRLHLDALARAAFSLIEVASGSANAVLIGGWDACRHMPAQGLLVEIEDVVEHAKLPHYLKCLYQEVLANHAGKHGWFSGDLMGNIKV